MVRKKQIVFESLTKYFQSYTRAEEESTPTTATRWLL